jgi:hypothetical protein
MIQCPICSAENEPAAESCRGCGFGLSFSRHAILDVVPVTAGPCPDVVEAPPYPAGSALAAETGVAAPAGAPAEGAWADQPRPVTSVKQPDGGAALPPEETEPGAGEEALAEPTAGLEVDRLLKNLRSEGADYVRWRALKSLGQLETSTPEIVKALLIARESGADEHTRDRATRLLQVAPHREVLQRHRELVEAAAAEVRANTPPQPAPLGPLELPGWLVGTRNQEPERELGAEGLARAREAWESAQVAERTAGAGADRPPSVGSMDGPGGEAVLRPEEIESGRPEEVLDERPADPEVAQLLNDLRSRGPDHVRWRALEGLGQLGTSTPEIVEALLIARESGADEHTRYRATDLLQTRPHRQVLQGHPELLHAAPAEVLDTPRERHVLQTQAELSETSATLRRAVGESIKPGQASERELKSALVSQPLTWDLDRIVGIVNLGFGLYLVCVSSVTAVVIWTRSSFAGASNAAMAPVLVGWLAGLGIAIVGAKMLRGRWDLGSPRLGWNTNSAHGQDPVGILVGWLISLLVWGFLRALPYLVVMVAPIYVIRDLIRFCTWLFG